MFYFSLNRDDKKVTPSLWRKDSGRTITLACACSLSHTHACEHTHSFTPLKEKFIKVCACMWAIKRYNVMIMSLLWIKNTCYLSNFFMTLTIKCVFKSSTFLNQLLVTFEGLTNIRLPIKFVRIKQASSS